MVRGCQRKVIFVKNTGSEMFDEALFFVSRDTVKERSDEDMIKEANRIISEQMVDTEKEMGFFQRSFRFALKYGVSFLLGAGITAFMFIVF